jgi:hypothetical protein
MSSNDGGAVMIPACGEGVVGDEAGEAEAEAVESTDVLEARVSGARRIRKRRDGENCLIARRL